MPGKGTTFSSDWLKLIFLATPIANIADNASASPLTLLWFSLHTADPTAGGSQTSSETSYGGYTRVSVARSGAGFTVTSNSVSPNGNILFPACVSGSATITHFVIGTLTSGAGKILYFGTVLPNIPVSVGVIPTLTVASSILET